MRTRVYVDGFNLYYGALRGTPYKWIDLVKLSKLLLPSECAVDKVCFFCRTSLRELGPQSPGASA